MSYGALFWTLSENDMDQYNNTWYQPGDWKLPKWWTDLPPARNDRMTRDEQKAFYEGSFVVVVLGHCGGITRPPRR